MLGLKPALMQIEGKYLELHRLLLWRQLGHQWDPRQEFLTQQPLYLEIGFGNGEYLARQAVARPQHNFLGIEMHWESVRRCLRRLAQQNCHNVRVLQMDARVALEWLLPDACLAGFTALFPCPWPKRQHERFRLFSTSFMGQLNRTLESGAGGLVVTDHQGLAEYASTQAPGSGLALRVDEVPASYNTKYERRWSGQGQQHFFELHYSQTERSPYQRVPEVVMQTLYSDSFDPAGLEARLAETDKVGDGDPPLVVDYRQVVHDSKKQLTLILVTVVEDSLNQTFWIEVAPKDGRWCVRPALGGGYLPTVGVQTALGRVHSLLTA